MAESRRVAPGRIFISYRRAESGYSTGWLYERLASHFGCEDVVRDIDSIELGDDFVEVIGRAVASCDVMLVVIGTDWISIKDDKGQRRLDVPEDFVRREIEAALQRDIRVIPILVDGATMPQTEQLPASLAKLSRRQALELSPQRFQYDTDRLLRVLDKTISEERTKHPTGKQNRGAVRSSENHQSDDVKPRDTSSQQDVHQRKSPESATRPVSAGTQVQEGDLAEQSTGESFHDSASAVGNFPTALRGYDRAAVDSYVRTLEAAVVSAGRRVAEIEIQLAEAGLSIPRATPPTVNLFDPGASAVGNFPTALRGYDRAAVDDYVRTLEGSVTVSRRRAHALEERLQRSQSKQ